MENNKKQTAVEWLVEKLKSQGLLIGDPDNLIAVREAKEMEKEQSINDYCNGRISVIEKKVISAEQYYNETYGRTI